MSITLKPPSIDVNHLARNILQRIERVVNPAVDWRNGHVFTMVANRNLKTMITRADNPPPSKPYAVDIDRQIMKYLFRTKSNVK